MSSMIKLLPPQTFSLLIRRRHWSVADVLSWAQQVPLPAPVIEVIKGVDDSMFDDMKDAEFVSELGIGT